MGTTWRHDIDAAWSGYRRFFAMHDLDEALVREVAERSLTATAAWAPALADEIAGIAVGAGLDLWQVAALNARSEVLARYRPVLSGECSTAAYLPESGAPRTIQTWDWYEQMTDVKLVWQYQPTPGRTVKTLTEFGILGKIGVTDQGLGLHFNLLQHDADGKDDGVPVHVIARRILDEATSVDHAEELARSARVSASVALTVLGYAGEVASGCVLELSPSGVARLDLRDDRFLLHTNHFIDAALASDERLAPLDPDSEARLAELAKRTARLRAESIADRASALVHHLEDGAALCCHPYGDDPVLGRWQTLLTIGLQLDTGRLLLHDGNPCTAGLEGWIRI